MSRSRLKFSEAVLVIFLSLSTSLCEQNDGHEEKNAKYVMTVLNAQWEATPIILEVAEYLAEENNDYLWTFIDGISSLSPPFHELATDKDRYETSIRVAGSVLSSAQKSLLAFSLGVHVNSPGVRMRAEMALQDGVGEALCDNVAFVGGQLLCRSEDVKRVIKETSEHKIDTYTVDHHYPGSVNRSITAILYGELGTVGFEPLHKLLAGYASSGHVHYVLRWNVKPRGRAKQRLSGYGVELQLKSTEYKSQDDSKPEEKSGEGAGAGGAGGSGEEEDENDPQNQVAGFNFGRLKNLFPDYRGYLDKFKVAMSQIDDELAPLKVWQMQKLSLQAGAAVAAAFEDSQVDPDHALTVLAAISQNFPMQTKTLVHLDVPEEFAKEIKHNQETWAGILNVHPSDAALFVNGVFLDMDANDVFSLLELLREDLTTLEVLHKIGVSGKIVTRLLSLEVAAGPGKSSSRSASHSTKSAQEFALDIRDTAVQWVNDLENDSQYKRWSSSYMELLRPAYPGMLRSLRRNLFSVVIVVNPVVVDSRAIIRLAESLVKHTAPVRVGVVLAPVPGEGEAEPSEDIPRSLRKAFNYVCQDLGNAQGLSYLTKITNKAGSNDITMEIVRDILKEVDKNVDLDDVFGADSEYDFGRQLAQEFVQKTGSKILPQAFANGVLIPGEDLTLSKFEDAILLILQKAISKFQRAIFRGELADTDDAMDYVMSQANVMPRLNNRILSVESAQHISVNGNEASKELLNGNHMEELATLTARDLTATAIANLRYFLKPFKNEKKEVILDTIWVVGDLNDFSSRKLLLTALQYMKSTRTSRVTFIPNMDGTAGTDQSLNKVVVAALAVMEGPAAADYVNKLLENEGCHERKDCDILPELVPALNRFEWLLRVGRLLSWRALGFKQSGSRGLVFNGRILGPLADDELFQEEDFSLLERFSNSVYGDKIRDILSGKKESANLLFEDTEISEEEPSEESVVISADSYLLLVAALGSRQAGDRSRFPLPQGLKDVHSVIKLPPRDPDSPAFSIVSVIDPASKAAQKLSPLLIVLRQIVNCEMLVYLNCEEKNSDMPVKSFYRLVLDAAPRFDHSGAERGAAARITRLPTSALLSMEVRAPAAWLVESSHAVYDLDNIRLSDVDSVVYSEFILAYILVEGHTWDSETGSPPRGLQLTLGPTSAPIMRDTLVMANLGYFQLKAYPGAWLLRLRKGRSHDIYEIVSHDNMETTSESDLVVLVHSLRGVVVTLRVAKKSGKQHLDLLGEQADENSGIWNSITSSFTGSTSADSEDQTINIFSVASGHLYERFLRIMMLSVLKNTKSPVKFWFLKNYLSPSLKEILPYMSREYGFEYELVEYQWPRWLQRQSDRQRTIWGYKILFLDVLFPLSVRKIIFVDADQIVRADLKELVDLDLGGAPYGYTPFCDSRTEMEGFRFWKQGYWRNHLQGRRYHISALYVVDLRRFRRVAAGDRLRGQYQALSQDPNSLSNLDQDLPNNMIHQVAIKSLPQEWLWCETWCDESSKSYAKTIDLCNNPQTKEAKLSAAMRIVPEWKEYDAEVKKLQAKVRRGDMDEEAEQSETHNSRPDRLHAGTPDTATAHTEL